MFGKEYVSTFLLWKYALANCFVANIFAYYYILYAQSVFPVVVLAVLGSTQID
jgi:hypothetical protein